MAVKDFTPKTRDKKVEFKLYGFTFHCAPMVRADVVLGFMDLVGDMVSDDGEVDEAALNPALIKTIVEAMNRLFKAAFHKPEEYKVWEEMRDSDETVIDVETLLEIGTYLGGEYASGGSDRPTGESSEDGSSKTSHGKGSRAGARPKALTYSRSEPTPLSV